jgi:hypothetical protein
MIQESFKSRASKFGSGLLNKRDIAWAVMPELPVTH